MHYQEKRTLFSTIGAAIIFFVYCWYMNHNYHAELFAEDLDLKFWAKSFLWFIGISMVGQILIYIFFAIINYMATREEYPKIEDERDKLVELKAQRVSHHIFLLGFIGGFISLMFDIPQYWMLLIMIGVGFISGMVHGFLVIRYYRRGF